MVGHDWWPYKKEMRKHIHTEGRPYEDTGERAIYKEKREVSEETNCWYFDLGLLDSRFVKNKFCCLNHLDCGTLIRQP